jgi:hypothetical protein
LRPDLRHPRKNLCGRRRSTRPLQTDGHRE